MPRAVEWRKARAARDPYDSRIALRLIAALEAGGNPAGAAMADLDEAERVEGATGERYKRLVELEDESDPENLFRLNQNIEPTGDR